MFERLLESLKLPENRLKAVIVSCIFIIIGVISTTFGAGLLHDLFSISCAICSTYLIYWAICYILKIKWDGWIGIIVLIGSVRASFPIFFWADGLADYVVLPILTGLNFSALSEVIFEAFCFFENDAFKKICFELFCFCFGIYFACSES